MQQLSENNSFITKLKTTFSKAKITTKETLKNVWVNHRKKTILGVIILVIIILIVAKNHNANEVTDPYTVATANITDQVVLSGRTESINSVDLGFADSGRVQHVFVDEGQKVKKGEVLAELEMGDLTAQLTNAKAGLVIAQANIREAGNNIDRVTAEQNALVETAKRNLFGNLAAYPADTFSVKTAPTIYGSYTGNETGNYNLDIYASSGTTGASVSFFGLESGVTSLTVDNRIALGTKGLYIQFPDNSYINSKWIIPVPNDRSSGYAALKNAYETAVATHDRVIATAGADLSGGTDQSVLQARADQARASVDQIYSAINRRKIVAPFSGTISAVGLKEGESTIGISKDTSPGVSMLATDQYKVVIKIPEIDVARISPNTPVSVTLDAYGPDKIFAGVLTSINPAETIVDGVPVYEGTVLFNEKNDLIRSGMTSTVTIVVGNKQNVLAIPGNYIREDKVARKYFVTVVNPVDDKKSTEREVKTGIRGSDGITEITSGLSAGEVVATPVKK